MLFGIRTELGTTETKRKNVTIVRRHRKRDLHIASKYCFELKLHKYFRRRGKNYASMLSIGYMLMHYSHRSTGQ